MTVVASGGMTAGDQQPPVLTTAEMEFLDLLADQAVTRSLKTSATWDNHET
jgi:hypothetical protein